MALIKCPECGKRISDQADACIYCGYPLKKKNSEEMQQQENNKESLVAESTAELAAVGEGSLDGDAAAKNPIPKKKRSAIFWLRPVGSSC